MRQEGGKVHLLSYYSISAGVGVGEGGGEDCSQGATAILQCFTAYDYG